MSQRRTFWVVLCLFLSGHFAFAQSNNELQQKAADAYQNSQWAEAAEAYRKIVSDNDADARGWYRLGIALRNTEQYAEAIEALDKAEGAGIPAAFTKVELAKVHAANGHDDKAVEALSVAVGGGYTSFQTLESDAAFADLQTNADFQQVVQNAKRNAMPCEFNERFNDFDFWVGQWDVADEANTQNYGSNDIQKSQNNCLMIEKWTSATGSTGTSMNYFDPSTGQWTQKWVSAGGLIIDITGGLEDASMVLTGTVYYVGNDQKFPFRGTWTPLDDGRVRQFFEQSNDEGETWSPWFDGYYTRKTPE